MLCQICHKNPATVHFTQVINNSRQEMYLCEKCAKEKESAGMGVFNINDFFSLLMGLGMDAQHSFPQSIYRPPVRCTVCGMTYDDFQRAGKMGCAECYKLYAENLPPLLKKLHGAVQHTGKVPSKIASQLDCENEIEKLKRMLEEAIRNEEYEKAAQIRDKIRDLESRS